MSAITATDIKCFVSKDQANSTPQAPRFILQGKGFTPKATYSLRGQADPRPGEPQGGFGAGGAVKDDGSLIITNVPHGTYFIESNKDGDVSCGPTPKERGKEAKYLKGWEKGYSDIVRDCAAKPPEDLSQKSKAWQKGYHEGAAKATSENCA
ncbi:hypothetical protein [Streptomyces sp. NPDC000410]|uniref:hypothetical protein n=1 Tax=Streptomyces sp. NPDC000410 TaxID=3154254 RepID=UPI003331187B